MKLVRSYADKFIFGVCGGLSETFGVDSTIIRLLFVAATIFGIGTPVLLYIILALLMPQNRY
jgi:phage shock protein C